MRATHRWARSPTFGGCGCRSDRSRSLAVRTFPSRFRCRAATPPPRSPRAVRRDQGAPRASCDQPGDVSTRSVAPPRGWRAPEGLLALVFGFEAGVALVDAPRHRRRRLYRLGAGRSGTLGPRQHSCRPHPLLRRTRLGQPSRRHRERRRGTCRRDRRGCRGLDDARRRAVLHEARVALRSPRRPRRRARRRTRRDARASSTP